MQKFEFLWQPLLGELAMSRKREREREREKEREKMPFIVATYLSASSQGQRTHSARTNYQSLIVQLENLSLHRTCEARICSSSPLSNSNVLAQSLHLKFLAAALNITWRQCRSLAWSWTFTTWVFKSITSSNFSLHWSQLKLSHGLPWQISLWMFNCSLDLSVSSQ